MVNTRSVVLIQRDSRVQQVCEAGKQVGDQEKTHLGGRAGVKQDLRGTERNGSGERAPGKTSLKEAMS